MLNRVRHALAYISRKYYFEDGHRVSPDMKNNNFLNHCKFYQFAAQFVKNKRVADIGCGTGYGCEILKKNGAAYVSGCDISKVSVKYAKSKFNDFADFSIQGITDLKAYALDSFDISVCSEVLEHIKKYGKEQKAIDELRRITKRNGLLVIGTPNSELSSRHGFSFREVKSLFQNNFHNFCIFENALLPFKDKRALWEKRAANGQVGIIISENINLSETVLPKDSQPEIKTGLKAGMYRFADYNIDTTILHNTHSWIIIAINEK